MRRAAKRAKNTARRWDEKISPKPDRTKSKTKDGDGRFNLIKTEIIYKE